MLAVSLCTGRTRSRTAFRTRKQVATQAHLTPSKHHAALAPSGSRAGIVTTVKDFAALADSWCAYHLSIGFEHLYVYFDDPDERQRVELWSRFPVESVTCVPSDAKLRDAWARMPNVAEILQHAKKEVQTR
mgnify:CR=1 FL=1